MKVWTKWHVLTISPTCAFMALCAVAVMKNKQINDICKKYSLKLISLLLIALEIFKQINSFPDETYRLYSLPFHYCSLFLYLLPLHAFCRGKIKPAVNTVTLAISSSLFFMMLTMPGGVYAGEQVSTFFLDSLSFHTVVFHSLVCVYLAIALFSGEFSRLAKHSVITIVLFLLGYSLVGASLAWSLETNFHNFYSCDITVLENMRQALIDNIGGVGQLIYMSAVALLTIVYSVVLFIPARAVAKRIGARAESDKALGEESSVSDPE